MGKFAVYQKRVCHLLSVSLKKARSQRIHVFMLETPPSHTNGEWITWHNNGKCIPFFFLFYFCRSFCSEFGESMPSCAYPLFSFWENVISMWSLCLLDIITNEVNVTPTERARKRASGRIMLYIVVLYCLLFTTTFIFVR